MWRNCFRNSQLHFSLLNEQSHHQTLDEMHNKNKILLHKYVISDLWLSSRSSSDKSLNVRLKWYGLVASIYP